MRKIIYFWIGSIFALFSLGVIAAFLYITLSTNKLNNLINLHQIDNLREELLVTIQTVQNDIFALRTPFDPKLETIIKNVERMDATIRECNRCHHRPEIKKRIAFIQGLEDKYKAAISFYITTSAKKELIEQYKTEALAIGTEILVHSQRLISAASKKIEITTQETLHKVEMAKKGLFLLLTFKFFLALFCAIYLVKRITRPLDTLVQAVKKITAGELGHVISLSDRTEFGILAKNFNTMSLTLKENYEKLVESETKFRTLYEYSVGWELWLNEKKEFIFCSPSCEKITGYSPEEFMGNPSLLRSIVYPDDRNLYEEHIQGFHLNDERAIEFRIIAKDGSIKTLSHLCRPIYRGNTFSGRRCSNLDVTEKKKLEAQLIQAQKMESLGLLAGGVAHDFNNILTAISGYTYLLNQTLNPDQEKQKKYISQIMEATDRAKVLTGNLLTFSRKQATELKMISLKAVLTNLYSMLKRLIRADIEVSLQTAEDERPILADPHQIEQVVMNLVTNARDAMPYGGKLIIATESLVLGEEMAGKYGAQPGPYMVIKVSDTGTGIDKEILPLIFDPFFTTKEVGRGTGLGLSMVYGIAKQHGGFVAVESEKNKGSTFFIYLPAVKEGQPTQNKDNSLQTDVEELRGNESILLVEDDPAVQMLIKDTLEAYGYPVLTAPNGTCALEIYQKYKNDIKLVILDAVIPQKTGIFLFKELVEISPSLKFLFTSGYAKDYLSERQLYPDGVEFLSKPLHPHELLKVIRRTLNNHA